MIFIIASKRSLRRAVDRNRAKRRIRAALTAINPCWRELKGRIYANQETLNLPFPELRAKIKYALHL